MKIATLSIFLFVFCLLVSGAQAQEAVYLKADTSSPLPFSDAVRVGNMLYLSGSIGVDDAMHLVPGGIEAETRQIMANVTKVLERNGSSLDRVVKATVMLADMKEWPAFNAVYRTYFKKERLPARSAFGTTGLAFGARAEVEFWATVK
jgi:reactive intermediate/imine deaminase